MSKDFYMDPQKLSNLDPKLREAYQRVMGTPIPQPQDTFSQNQSQTPPPIDPNSGSTPIPDPTPVPTPVPEPELPSSTVNGSIPTSDINPAITPDEPTSPAIQPPTEPVISSIPVEPAPGSEPAPASRPPPAIAPEPAPKFDRLNSQIEAASAPQVSPNFSTPAPQAQAITIKKKNNLMPILIGVVILVFLVVYALFWVKVFNFKLPF